MKLIKLLMLCFVSAFMISNAAGQANASLNILTLQGGQVVIGGTVNIQVTVGCSIGSAGQTTGILANKVRAQISVPSALVSILPNAQQTGLPPGWTITVNSGSAITVCNGSDVIPVDQARIILIKVQGNTLGGPSTVNGNLLFSSGTSCTTPGSLPGDNTADNSSTSSVTVINPVTCNLAVTGNAGPAITCNGGTTTLTATATGASGPVEYSINAGVDFQDGTAFTVSAGTYTVIAREKNNLTCTASSTPVVINQPAVITASAIAGVACFGGNTTILTVTATGGTGTLQYSLNGGAFQAGNTFSTVTTAGSPYVVTVRDANLCTGTSNSVTVTESPAISASASAAAITCNGGSTTLTVTASGGIAPFEYSLSGGAYQPGNTFTVNAIGSPYSVRVRDANSCVVITNTVTVTQPTAISASASAGTIACNGGTTTLTVTASGGTGALQYSLNGGAFQSGNTFTVNAAGSTYTVTVRDANLCTATTNVVTVIQPTAITATASAGTINCFGGTTTLTVTASGGTGTLQYSLNGGAFQSGNTFTVNAAGSPYTVSVKDANLCTATTNTVTVTQPAVLSATATSTPVTSIGGSNGTATAVPTGGTAPYTYSWAPGGQTGITATGITAGSYTVTVTDSKGCTTTATTTVGSPSCNISASASAGTIACNGGSATLTVTVTGGTAPIQYSLNGGAFQSGNTFSVNAAGSPYTVSVKDANLCTATTNTVTVTQPTAISASASAGTINCNGGTTTLTVTASGGTGTLQYSLNGGAFQSGNTFTVNAAGSPYTVTVRDANQCTATSNVVTVTQPTVLSATATSTPVTSIGGSNGTATAVPTGGTAPYTYSWAPGGQTGITATGITAGSYTVTVTDSKGCTTTATTTVGSPSCNISASASAGTIACNGGSTTLTVTVTGGTAPIQYSLNGGAFQSGNTFSVNAAGSPYTVSVKDANLCTATTNTVTVTQPTAISASASAGTINCNGGTTTLTVTASGGTGTLQYSLNGGAFQSGNTFTVNAAGSPYTVTVRDVNLCTATTNVVTVIQPTVLSATATSTPVSSIGGSNGTATVVPAGGTAPYTYSWAPGGQTGITATGLTAGSYTVTVTDARGCTTTATTTVGSPSCNISASASAGTIACNGGSTTLTVTVTGGTAPIQYSLNGGAFQSGNTFSVNAAGSPYTVSVKDANMCTATTNTVTVTQPTTISASASAGTINCNGGTTTLTVTASGGTGTLQYSLNGGAFQSGNTFTVNAAGSPYTVTVRDVNLCTATTNVVTVIQPTVLSATATSTPVASIGGSNGTATAVPIGGTAPYTYSWAPGGQTTITATGLTAGSYTVTVTDSKGCTITATTTVGTQGPTPLTATIVKNNLSVCGGSNDGAIFVTASGGTAPYSYSWTGFAGPGQTPFNAGNVSSVTGLNYGFYNVTVTDAVSATYTVSNINVQFAFAVFITFNGSASSSCSNSGSIILYGNAGVRPYTYSLNGTTYQSSNSFTDLAPGTYTGFVKDAAGCVSQRNGIVVSTAAPVTISTFVKAATSCANDGSIEIFKTGGVPGFTYSIDNVNYQVSNKFLNLPAGPYTAWVKDSKGCTASQNVIVAQGVALSVSASKTNSSVCVADGTIQVNASGGIAPYTFNLNGGLFQSSNSFSGLAAGIYIVGVNDSKGCIGSLNVTIGSNQIIVTANTLAASSCTSNNGSVQLFRTGGFGPYTYSIDGNIFQSSSIFTGVDAGTYTGFVKDSKGCMGMLAGIVVGPAGCGGTTVSTLTKGSINNVPELSSKAIKVQAYPNPSATEFIVALEGFSNTKAINITVTDILGKVVYQTQTIAKLQFKFGSSFIAGTYVMQVLQGNERKSLKLIKE